MFGEKNHEIVEDLSFVHISLIENREGQILRNELKKVLYVQGEKTPAKYVLSSKITSSDKDLTYLSDQTAGRKMISVSVSYELKEKRTNKILTAGSLSRSAEYNVESANSFGTIISSERVKLDAIRLLSGDLFVMLTKHFIDQKEKTTLEESSR